MSTPHRLACLLAAFLVACGSPTPSTSASAPGAERGGPPSPPDVDTAAPPAELSRPIEVRVTLDGAAVGGAVVTQPGTRLRWLTDSDGVVVVDLDLREDVLAVVAAHSAILARGFVRSYGTIERLSEHLTRTNAELVDTNKAITRFVPYEFLSVLERRSIVEVQRGDHIRQVMDVMFCDLRSFTPLIEALGPDRAFGFINHYLRHMEPEIHGHGGFINQYFGDGIMALFRAGADEALLAAVGMQRALDRFNAVQTYTSGEPLRIGIGVNAGPLMLGTIGGRDRLDAGVIGDPVNLAARLEGMTKIYRTTVLVGENTVARLVEPGAFRLRELDQVAAKGKTAPVAIFELLDALPTVQAERRWDTRDRYAEGLAAYRAGAFSRAVAAFEDCLAADPDDGPAGVLAERAAGFAASPPPSWDGVTRLTRKQ